MNKNYKLNIQNFDDEDDSGISVLTYDTSEEERITIDERTLNIPTVLQTIGVENDNNVERVYFELPRYFDEVNDLSEFNIYINYMNANNVADKYYCDDVTIEGDNIVFSWLTARLLYEAKGTVKFIVCAIHSDGREWNSTLATLNVLEGLETEEAIVDSSYSSTLNDLITLANETMTELQSLQEEVTDLVDTSLETLGDYEIVNENPVQFRFKKVDGTYGDIITIDTTSSDSANLNNGYAEIIGNPFTYSTSKNGVELSKIYGNYSQDTTPSLSSISEPTFVADEGLEVVSHSYNLFDSVDLLSTISSGVTMMNNGHGGLTFSGTTTTATANIATFTLTHEETVNLLKEGTLTLEVEEATMPYVIVTLKNSSKTYITLDTSSETSVSDTVTSTMLADSNVYLYIQIYATNGGTITNTTINPMLYQDGDGTFEKFEYAPQILDIDKPLRALPSGVQDVYENGYITRYVGAKTFDGTEDFTLSSGNVFTYELENVLSGSTFLSNYLPQSAMTTNSTADIMYLTFSGITDVDTLQSTLSEMYENGSPLTVYYEYTYPREEKFEFELIRTFSPHTVVKVLDDLADDDTIEFRSKIYETESDSDYNNFLNKFFNMQRTGKIYTVRFPMFDTSNSPTGEKLDSNVDLTCVASTDTIEGQDDYQDIPLFKTYDVNAYVDGDGVRHVTAIKGDTHFKDTGKVDVFVMGMAYYEKYYEQDGYWYYSRTDTPTDGYTLAQECVNRDGSVQSFALYAKYTAGEIDGVPYSSKGLVPKRKYPCYNNNIAYYHKKGRYYSGMMTCEQKYLMTTFYLKYATLNTQSIMYGMANYNYQYVVSSTESNVNRVILTSAQANNLIVGSYVSIGDLGSNISVDRGNDYMHSLADNVQITSIEATDDTSYYYVYVDSDTFTTTTTTYLSTMPYVSGYSDDILGRDGSLNNNTNGKNPMVLQGIEVMQGQYNVISNIIMDIQSYGGSDYTRVNYIMNDVSRLTTNVTVAKNTFRKSEIYSIPTTGNAHNYITEMQLDYDNGAFLMSKAGASGSGSGTGFCDSFYVDGGTSGQREMLAFGNLIITANAGLSYVNATYAHSNANWSIASRVSLNGVGGFKGV